MQIPGFIIYQPIIVRHSIKKATVCTVALQTHLIKFKKEDRLQALPYLQKPSCLNLCYNLNRKKMMMMRARKHKNLDYPGFHQYCRPIIVSLLLSFLRLQQADFLCQYMLLFPECLQHKPAYLFLNTGQLLCGLSSRHNLPMQFFLLNCPEHL